MTQALAIQQILDKINDAIQAKDYADEASSLAVLNEIKADLKYFHQTGIDFKDVVDNLDNSIYITDKEGKVLYVNPAYEKNTAIHPEEVLGRYTQDIIDEGSLFTGGATMDVIHEKKKIFRLSTVQRKHEVGYAVGVPLFDRKGELKQVVVSSRPILSLQSLSEDYDRFLDELGAKKDERNIKISSGIEDHTAAGFIGSSSAWQKVGTLIDKAAPTDATILITGESGVGKEVVADEIYRLSQRSNKTFVKVNCASIPASLLESELFGYEKGAFSGANPNGKKGLFETANGGTLLLDEIGDMPMDLQVKLLRALQDRKITRVGGTKPIDLDIRFIASTNSNLKEKIKSGDFRSDLYYRLNVIPISIPPLRDRPQDIEDLIEHFRVLFSEKHQRPLVLSESNMDIFRSYHWPGNVRELENVVEYLTICASGGDHVDPDTIRGILDVSQETVPPVEPTDGTLSQLVENYEKNLIENVLRNSTSLRDAGNKLGVNASTISRKIKQYGIEYPKAK